MTRINKSAYLFLLLLLFVIGSIREASAQFSKSPFGKNRIQYKSFEWQYVATPNFEIYFYGKSNEIARLAAMYAEADFPRITDLLGYSPYNKTKIFIYNSIVDLQQSNIGVTRQNFSVAGQTNFIKSEIELAFTGDKASFKKELAHGIADVLIFEMMYGGNLKDMLQNTYLLNLPDWFIAGASQYIAEGWSVEMDDFMRDALKNRKLKKPANLEGVDARMVGQSIWNYIAEEYGKSNITNILNLTRVLRNEESGIQNTLGVSYQRFINNWKKFYTDQLVSIDNSHAQLNENQRLKSNRKELIYNDIKLHPSKGLIAFSENNRGRYHVIIRDLGNGRERTVLSGGYRVINQKADYNIPLLGWKDEKTLAVINAVNGKNQLWLYNLDTRKSTRFALEDFNHISDFDISDDGSMLIMSAEKNGQSDIYSYDLDSKTVKQLTNDGFDDLAPSFLKKSYQVVFSSNRLNDTLAVKGAVGDISERFNIFIYNPKQNKVLRRVTNTLSKDLSPIALDENTLLFRSDQRGIFHLYRYDMRNEVSTQVSSQPVSITSYDFIGKRLAMVVFYKGRQQIMTDNNFDIMRSAFTPKTARQQLMDARVIAAMKAQAQKDQPAPVVKDTIPVEPEPTDTTKTKSNEIDTDNYQFDTFARNKKKKLLKNYRPTIVEETRKVGENLSITGPYEYENRFSADNLVFSFAVDPLRSDPSIGAGVGGVLETSMTDVLENHKINAGIFVLTNFRNSNYYAEYEYLKHRLDYRVRLDREAFSIMREDFQFVHRYALNKLQASVSYPLNITTRFTVAPFLASTRGVITSELLTGPQKQPDRYVYYAGSSAEFVFDNSLVTGLNMLEGVRMKIRYENYLGLNKANKSFGNISIDARAYKKLSRSLILATRFAYGQFLGKAKKSYRLGGMDNWLFNRTDNVKESDPLYINPNITNRDYSDLLFAQYITNLRGFNYNKLYGSNFMLFNAELRLPVLKYFYKGNVTSNFFRNLQLVGFTDIGASWTGLSPFNRQNALNTKEVNQGPFAIQVSNFKNPFLIGYGFGMRTMVLGYYTKLDVAWGLEDGVVVSPGKVYLTLGYDF